MPIREYEFELEEFCAGHYFATVWIKYEILEAEGETNSGESIDILETRVTSLSSDKGDKMRAEIDAFFLPLIDQVAADGAYEALDDGWLREAIITELTDEFREGQEDW
jgi:hypothetical protein